MTSPVDLPAAAARIVEHLREHFPPEQERERQILALAEEVGEFVGAARRYLGMARRPGTFAEMAAELADVVITAHVTAEVYGQAIAHKEWRDDWPGAADPVRWVLGMVGRVDSVIGAAHLSESGIRVEADLDLSWFVAYAYRTAALFSVDLDAEIASKLTVIFTRGWKDPADA